MSLPRRPSLDDGLWMTAQQTRMLRALRQDAAPLWSDGAAQDLAELQLDPLEAEADALLGARAEQLAALGRAEAWLRQLDERGSEAERLATALRVDLERARVELGGGWEIHELADRYAARARERLSLVEADLARAEQDQ
jgi:hypothetical protein